MNFHDAAAQLNSVSYWKERAYQAEKQRDHWRYTFAGMAMQGLLANSYSNGHSQPLSEAPMDVFTHMAVEFADLLLKELEATNV